MKITILLLVFSVSTVWASRAPLNKSQQDDFKYEVNTAPLAFMANWYSLDFIKYNSTDYSKSDPSRLGYGLSYISFLRNNNNAEDTFPSRIGLAVGGNAALDYKDHYNSVHVFYEKFENYHAKGTQVQETEGFRGNVILLGGKEKINKNFELKFGWGLEFRSYKIHEYIETNKSIQNSYYTMVLNPFFIEVKLAGLF